MGDKKKKGGKHELSKVEESSSQALSLEQVMAHPAVQQLNQKLEETRQLIAGLPEAIGRAVAEAQRAGKVQALPLVSGPPVQLKSMNDNVEFHRKGRIVQNGKEVAPEGPTQGDFVRDLGSLRKAGGPAIPTLPAPVIKPPEPPSEPPPADPASGN